MSAPSLRRFRFFPHPGLLCGLALCLLPGLASARPHRHPGKNRGSEPAPAAPADWIPPGDWPAAARVNAFLQTYLEQSILAPLDAAAPAPRTALGTMAIDFASRLAAAKSPAEHSLFSDAVGLFDLLGRLLDERERQQDALLGARSGGRAVNPLDMPASAVSGTYSWNLEAERARAQARQEVQARLNALDKKDFLVVSKLRQWSDQTSNYRKSVQVAAIRVNADQAKADAAAHAPAAPAAVAPPSETAAAPAPAPGH